MGREGAAGHAENLSDALKETHFSFSGGDATRHSFSRRDVKDPVTLQYPRNTLPQQVV